MSRFNSYKLIEEKYTALISEEKVVRQISPSDDEKKILIRVYDFNTDKNNEMSLRRIPAAGEIEYIVKYSDGSFIKMKEDSRGVTKFEYDNYYDLVRNLTLIYKPLDGLNNQQTIGMPDDSMSVQIDAPEISTRM